MQLHNKKPQRRRSNRTRRSDPARRTKEAAGERTDQEFEKQNQITPRNDLSQAAAAAASAGKQASKEERTKTKKGSRADKMPNRETTQRRPYRVTRGRRWDGPSLVKSPEARASSDTGTAAISGPPRPAPIR
ncbi:hypothetical protein C4D60_Mb06t35240 [Musa balbisiana]|uniref:Uncharacterized protein n=1 Tax=Musa balbisiana TaxID=52838 RepID=A0A4V4H4E6_MUSBA|nr:hypothetical protein C4D60_Mb06t35240 [Musa balbisiana]